MSEPTLREWKKMFWYPECPPGAALWGRLSIQNWTFARNRGQEDALKSFFVFGFGWWGTFSIAHLSNSNVAVCRFFRDGKIFEKEEPLERLVPYGSNNNHNKDNNILGSVLCLMWMHYNGVRSLVPSGPQLGVKGAETVVTGTYWYICHQSRKINFK